MTDLDLDPVVEAGLIARAVRTGSRDGEATRTVVVRRTLAASQARVWDALTTRGGIEQWDLPITGDLRLGGRYRRDNSAEGTVEKCEAPSAFSVTQEVYGNVSWLHVALTEVAEGTEVEIAEESLLDWDSWGEYGPCLSGVAWDFAMASLGLYLSSGVPIDQDVAGEFTHTARGREFVRHSADRWADAAFAAGDDSQAASNSAQRAVAFFTEPPPDDFGD